MLKKWLRNLIRWIWNRFQKKTRAKILRRYYSEYCAILQVQRTTPGAVDTYRIIPRDGNCDYLLTLDFKRALEAEMAGEFNGASFLLRSRKDSHEALFSHRVAVFRLYRNGNFALLQCWDMNLEHGQRGAAFASLAPKIIFARAIRSILEISPTKVLGFGEQIEIINWLGLIENAAKECYGDFFSLRAMKKI